MKESREDGFRVQFVDRFFGLYARWNGVSSWRSRKAGSNHDDLPMEVEIIVKPESRRPP